MRKGLLVLCSIGILSLSLVSCNGKESKINNKSAEDIMKTATEETMKNIDTIMSGNFIGVSFSTSSDLTAKIKVTDTNGLDGVASSTVSQKTEVAANIDVTKLDSADPAAIEFYELNKQSQKEESTLKENKDAETVVNSSDAETISEAGLNLGVYTEVLTMKQNGEEYTNSDSVNLIDIGAYGELTSNVKDAIDSYNGNGDGTSLDDDLVGSVDPDVIFAVASTLVMVDSFFNGDIDAETFVTSLEEMLNMELGTVEHDVAITLANLVNDNNPMDYISYTQIKTKDNLTIKASLDYSKWKKDFTKSLDGIVSKTNPELESYGYLQIVQYFTANLLPESLNLTYSFTTTNNIITKITTDVSAKGTLSGEFIGTLMMISGNNQNISKDLKINYEVSESTVAELALGNTPVTVKKLTV